MRLLRVVLTSIFAVIALVAGIVLTAVVAVGGILMLIGRRMLGRIPAATPATPPRPPARHRVERSGPHVGGEVIDVTATEVRSDPSSR